ncbi:MAG: acyl carrier protein [Alphaproteobacteria bacterium]
MADVFGVETGAIDDKAAPGRIEKWDSIRHIQLVLALEQRFHVVLEDEEIPRLVSLKAIVAALASKLPR